MSPFRNPTFRVLALLTVVWGFIGALTAAVTNDVPRSLAAGGLVVGSVVALIAAIHFVAAVPPVGPRLIMLMVARRERFDVTGFPIGRRLLYRDAERRWRLAPAADWGELDLIPRDEEELAARLIRVWRVLPIAAGATLVVGLIAGLYAEAALRGSVVHDFAVLLGVLFLFGNALKLSEWSDEGDRSPRSIARALREGSDYGAEELAYAATNLYLHRDVRPREYTPAIMATLVRWLREEPYGHEYRYLVFRYLTDTGDLAGLAEQRAAILGMEAHLRSDPAPTRVWPVVWYAAYSAPSAEEAERIWGWLAAPSPGQDTAEVWLRARIAALREDPATARTLAERARADYLEFRREGWTLAFEVDHIERLIASLPPEEPEG